MSEPGDSGRGDIARRGLLLVLSSPSGAGKTTLAKRLLEIGVSLDEARLYQEAALLATRVDVEEELKRLTAHIAGARELLVSREPAGRRLDFLAQEFNREANTLGSKSVDQRTTRSSVELKVLIEQLREQVQNVE